MKSRVVVLPCDCYEGKKISRLMRDGVKLLGGWRQIASPEEKILLKPNLVRQAKVERAVITHPLVTGAAACALKEEGFHRLACGDSCGVGSVQKILQESGTDRLLKTYGAGIREFAAAEKVRYEADGISRTFMLAKDVLESDCLISLSKMKTHALERITGAVKNQYGCICGFYKAKGHAQYRSADSFARMLVDLNLYLKPRLYIMDGITAMEGNGPTSGNPVHMGVLLLSQDPVALDSVFCRMVHLNPACVPTNVYGRKMGLGTWKEEEIEMLTPEGEIFVAELKERFGNPDFAVDRSLSGGRGLLGRFGFLKSFQKKPVIDEGNCRKCGVCIKSCPVEGKAVSFVNGRGNPPVYDYRKCIRCFCCQEMCPYKAIDVK